MKRSAGSAGDIGVGLSLLVAFCAGCGNVVLTNPIWVVATRMQAHQKSIGTGAGDKEDARSTPSNVAREIYEESGLKVPLLLPLTTYQALPSAMYDFHCSYLE